VGGAIKRGDAGKEHPRILPGRSKVKSKREGTKEDLVTSFVDIPKLGGLINKRGLSTKKSSEKRRGSKNSGICVVLDGTRYGSEKGGGRGDTTVEREREEEQ